MIILVVKDNVITKYEENADTFNDNFHPISQFSSLFAMLMIHLTILTKNHQINMFPIKILKMSF